MFKSKGNLHTDLAKVPSKAQTKIHIKEWVNVSQIFWTINEVPILNVTHQIQIIAFNYAVWVIVLYTTSYSIQGLMYILECHKTS